VGYEFINRLSARLAFSSSVQRARVQVRVQVLTDPCSTRRVRAQAPPDAVAARVAMTLAITLPCVA